MGELMTSVVRQVVTLPVMLVVDDHSNWRRSGRHVADISGLHWTDFAHCDAQILVRTQPDVVLSPLFSAQFDAIDLAEKLQDLGYRGRYRALAVGLPKPAIVRREIAAVAPDVDFDIFVIDDEGLRILPQKR